MIVKLLKFAWQCQISSPTIQNKPLSKRFYEGKGEEGN